VIDSISTVSNMAPDLTVAGDISSFMTAISRSDWGTADVGDDQVRAGGWATPPGSGPCLPVHKASAIGRGECAFDRGSSFSCAKKAGLF
jgi:hypothetical protein